MRTNLIHGQQIGRPRQSKLFATGISALSAIFVLVKLKSCGVQVRTKLLYRITPVSRRAQPGITDVYVNSWCQSVTLHYDSYWTPDTLSAFLQQLPREQIAQYELLWSQNEDVGKPWIQPSTCWRAAGYFLLVIGIILFVLPMIPGGTPSLLLSVLCFSKADELKIVAAVI